MFEAAVDRLGSFRLEVPGRWKSASKSRVRPPAALRDERPALLDRSW